MSSLNPTVRAAEEKPRVYVFCWPSGIGGADTKLVHLLLLLHQHCDFTLIPNDAERLREHEWTDFLTKLGIKYCLLDELPKTLEGIALSLSNSRFFVDRIAHRAKERGLKVVWSSEMMWHHPGELDACREGIVDVVLYVSEIQKQVLSGGYGNLPGVVTGNYVHPPDFPFVTRTNTTFAIGRLSRPAPEKYPEDFPVFYQALGLPDVRFRVMAWSDKLEQKYRWHRWDDRWEKLAALEESSTTFLQSLDLFVYPLGHRFIESWGRSTVEAMLTGAIPLVPRGHHMDHLIEHGISGFLCSDFAEWQEHAQRLRSDFSYRTSISKNARERAETVLCSPSAHRAVWLELFTLAALAS
jgi:glycosyltransferase involved in cell wall biosynthesis